MMTPHHAAGDVPTVQRVPAYWWRRAVAYVLGVVLPWSLLAQLYGTLLVGRSSPEGEPLIGAAAFATVVGVSAFFTREGQSPTHCAVGLRVCDREGTPLSRPRAAVRNLAHLADIATLGLGFLWPLWDREAQTFADKLCGTRVLRCDATTCS